MAEIRNMNAFSRALEALSLEEQRLVGARFLAEVLDLTDDEGIKQAQKVAANSEASPEELMAAYHHAHHAAVLSSLHSDLELVNWRKQAAFFVAKACASCLSPVHEGTKWCHLALNVSHYCRMARTCASIEHEQTEPSLSVAEDALNKQIRTQFKILSDFLDNR